MKKLLILYLLCPLLVFGQIKIKDLPTTTTGTTGDFLLKDDAAGIPGSTKKISIANFISTYSLTAVKTGATLYVDAVYGNNSTGLRGRLDKPFLTITAAQTAASSGDLIVINPGTYTDTDLGKNGVRYYFNDGAIMSCGGKCFAANGITFSVDGNGEFISNGGRTFEFQGATNAYIDCKRIERVDASSTAVHCIGTGTIFLNVKADITTTFQSIYVAQGVLYLNASRVTAYKYGLMSIGGNTYANVGVINVSDATAIDHACVYNDGGTQRINSKLLYYDCSTGTQGAIFMNNSATGNVSIYGDIQVVNTEAFFYLNGTNDKLFHRGKLYGNGTFTFNGATEVDIESLTTDYPATAGGVDTYTANISPAIKSYQTNSKYYIKFTSANTGASTLNLNSNGAVALKKNGTTALSAGDISAGQVLVTYYDGTNFQIIGGGGSASTSTVTPTSVYAGTGITVTGSIPSYTVTNASPDQTVSITGAGTATVTGTYPNFTITTPSGGAPPSLTSYTLTTATSNYTVTFNGTSTANLALTQSISSTTVACTSTFSYSSIPDGATVGIDFYKLTSGNFTITFPSGTVVSQSCNAIVSGLTAALVSTATGQFEITIIRHGSVYKVYIAQDAP